MLCVADIIFFKKYIPLISLDGRGYNFRIFIIIYYSGSVVKTKIQAFYNELIYVTR